MAVQAWLDAAQSRTLKEVMMEILDGDDRALERLCGERLRSGSPRDLAGWRPSLLAEVMNEPVSSDDGEAPRWTEEDARRWTSRARTALVDLPWLAGNVMMPHKEGTPVWVRVGRTDHHDDDDDDDDDDEVSGESDGGVKAKLPNAQSINKRSGMTDPETLRNGRATKKTRESETATDTINKMRSASADKKTSMMIVELGDEHTKCTICYDKFSTDVNNEDEGIRMHLPVLSSSQRCDHW